MTRALLLGLVLATASFAAAAQSQKVFRCVDESGRTYYTEKMGRNCKPTGIRSLPGGTQAVPAASARKAAAPKAPASPVVVAGPLNPCASLHAKVTRLETPSGRNEKVREARLAAMRQALEKDCRG